MFSNFVSTRRTNLAHRIAMRGAIRRAAGTK